jgi:hypothetical protein
VWTLRQLLLDETFLLISPTELSVAATLGYFAAMLDNNVYIYINQPSGIRKH